MLTADELQALLLDEESDRVERKRALTGDVPTKIREAICAFANDLPDYRMPGVVFVGANPDGSAFGTSIDDQLLRTLSDMKLDGRIVPPPSMAVRKVELAGGSMAVIEVQPSDAPPVRLDGRVLIRIGPRRGVATGQDERILSEKRRFRDKPFDAHPVPSAAISDLDQRYFEMEYVPRAIAPDLLEMNNRTYPERLSALKMIDSPENGLPTVAGLLVLSPRVLDFLPGAYVQFVRFAGQDTNSAILDEARIDGPVGQVLARLEDKLKANLKQEVAIGTDLHEERRPDYPLLALQQIVRNALLHRTYEHTNAPVRVYWFADHIEIASPGGPFGAVTTENFGAPHATDYRNPTLAEAMRVLGFVQRFGFGIPAARAELTKNGNPQPEFAVTPEFVTVIVRGRS